MTNSIMDAYIVDGNITLFFGSHSNSFKQDILNSSLLGHLAANTKNEIASDVWFASYRKILGSIFWTTKSHANQNQVVKSASLLKIAKLSLASYLTPAQLVQLAECITFIGKLPKDSGILSALLNRVQSTDQSESRATTTICPMLTIICEDKTVVSTDIHLEIAEPVGVSFLEEEVPLKQILGALQLSQWVTHLGESNYADMRNSVIGKLGNKINTRMFHLDIAKP